MRAPDTVAQLLGCPAWCDTTRHFTDPVDLDGVIPLLHHARIGAVDQLTVELEQVDLEPPTVVVNATDAALRLDDVHRVCQLLEVAARTLSDQVSP
jgi:hypothetical protein